VNHEGLHADPPLNYCAPARMVWPAPAPQLTRHGLVAEELGRWRVLEGNQGAMVDETHFYGIGHHTLVQHRKDKGERVAEWFGPRGGPIVHFNAGYVEDGRLMLAHSNFPQQPMASSLEIHDAGTLQPVSSHSFGIWLGSHTWAPPPRLPEVMPSQGALRMPGDSRPARNSGVPGGPSVENSKLASATRRMPSSSCSSWKLPAGITKLMASVSSAIQNLASALGADVHFWRHD
jgi:hypothetical protein